MKIKDFKGTIATDLKLANLLTVIMSHSSSFPCTWCTASKDNLQICGEYRTVGNYKDNYFAWQENGSKKSCVKNYKKCTNTPIFFSENDSTQIIDIIIPPELHLMLGVVNKLFKHMLLEFEDESLKWAKICKVTREFVHGSPAFAGNSCKILLEKIDILRGICRNSCLKYVKCFKDFQTVFDSCFSSTLKPKYIQYISDFKRSYCDLNISITPKVHSVFFHVPDFCSKVEKGLGFYSEQAIESVHSDFKTMWAKYKVSSTHPEYPSKLLKAVQEYNAQHV